jgi:hypothetical protein
MRKIIYISSVALLLTACASSFYSTEKRTKNNTVQLKTNVSSSTIKFPNAKAKDKGYYNQELKVSSDNYTLTYPKLKKRLLTVEVNSGGETKTIELKRVPRGGAIFKSTSLGLITHGLPFLIDPFNPDFYKVNKNSREVSITFDNPNSSPAKNNDNAIASNSKTSATVSNPKTTNTSSSKASESDGNTVRLTVSAQGKTKEEAKYNALRDALERAFGTFISSNTQILNDELIKDEIVSISSGNIEHFDIKSEVQLPDGTYSNVVDVTVSVNKLKSFCESKGIEVEFQGGLFAANIKLQNMNKDNEKIVIQNMYEIIETLAKVGYDFSVEVREPRESYSYNNAYDVELIVGAKFNANMVNALEIMKTTISGLYLSSEEVATLKKQNTSFYPLSIGGASGYLRSFSSVISVKHLCERIIPYYSTKFVLNNGLQQVNGIDIISGKADRFKISNISVSKVRPEWPRDARNNPRYGNQYSGIKNNYKLYRLNKRGGYSYVSKYVSSIPSVGKDMNRTYRANIYDDYNDNYLIEVSTTDISNTEIVFPITNVLTLDELSKVNEFKVSKVTN